MQSIVLPVAFVGAIALFALWLVVMLRLDRTHHVALATLSRERSHTFRQHAQAAQRASVVPLPDLAPASATSIASVSVRAGSFCRVPGNIGRTKKGVVLVCEANSTGRPRWRRPEALRVAS